MLRRLAVVLLFVGLLAAAPVQAEVRFHRPIQGKSVTFVLDEWDKLADGSFKNCRTNKRKTPRQFWDFANGLAMDTAFASGYSFGRYQEMLEPMRRELDQLYKASEDARKQSSER